VTVDSGSEAAGSGGPQVDLVLVPVDGEAGSMTAVEHAAAVAGRYDATVHAVYVYGPERARELDDGDADPEAMAERAQSVLAGVREVCEDGDVALSCSTALGFSTARLSHHPGSVILDCAAEVDADVLVIPREHGSEPPGVLAKAAEYVLAYASQPVLSV